MLLPQSPFPSHIKDLYMHLPSPHENMLLEQIAPNKRIINSHSNHINYFHSNIACTYLECLVDVVDILHYSHHNDCLLFLYCNEYFVCQRGMLHLTTENIIKMWWEKLYEVMMMMYTLFVYKNIIECISTKKVIEYEDFFRFESWFF